MEKTQKNDFIEIEFIGRVKGGEVFDTNIPEEAKKINLKIDAKPMIACISQGMVLEGLDKSLEDKEFGKQYTISLSPEQAFGKRKKELIRLLPKHVFTQQQISPRAGMTLSLDNQLVRIASVSGGRVLVDFNNPLAGKEVEYEFKINRKISELSEKIKGIIEFFFKGQKVDYEIKDKKIVFKTQEQFKPLIEKLNEKFKGVLGYELVFNQEKNNNSDNSISPQ